MARTSALRAVSPEIIRQSQLKRYRELEKSIHEQQEELARATAALEAKFPQLETERKQLAALASNLFELLDAGAEIEDGPRTCSIHEIPGKRMPKYKEELEKAMGKPYVDAVIANTLPGPGRRELIVDFKKA